MTENLIAGYMHQRASEPRKGHAILADGLVRMADVREVLQ